MVQKKQYLLINGCILGLHVLILLYSIFYNVVHFDNPLGLLRGWGQLLPLVIAGIVVWIGMPESQTSPHIMTAWLTTAGNIIALTVEYPQLHSLHFCFVLLLFLTNEMLHIPVMFAISSSLCTSAFGIIQNIITFDDAILVNGMICMISLIFLFYNARLSEQGSNTINTAEFTNVYKQELHHDHLTGVYSRSWFMHNAEEKIRYIAGKRRLGIAMIDIDHFKHVNDTYGHEAGDKVLQRLGKLLTEMHSSQIFTGRYGGEEFCIIFDNMQDDQEQLDLLRKKFEAESYDFTPEHFTLSGGLFHIESAYTTAEQAIAEADKKLYWSKEHGRNQITA
ncbi:GGDEF domain-containing protein [Butyrivibrio sp.]|uniref:GGDEF domain-containing protein n=1 Tax=Butyrivibrio sp. TaxID=28121 RepID=UPI0025B95A16|nr:GGDEF domain-containing protein [Butyrivibrio sp.]MBQ7430220.1 GGDEF domain-containing protein [Butyrivibrio sp.]MBQ9303394.1 GGDEF domain-containing protein [Butyrivibrio sp.]